MEKQNIPVLRFPGFQASWETEKLGRNIEVISGFPFKSEFFAENGKKLVIPKNFTKFGFGNFSDSFTKSTSEEVDEKYICSENDLLVLLTDLTSSCELLGKPLYLTSEEGEVLLNQRIIKIVPDEKKLLKRWLLSFLLTENYHKRIKETSSGTTVRHSSNKIINNINLAYPTLQEQQKIASFLTAVDSKLQGLKKKKGLLEQYKKGLMQKLFSQALRFKDENGNPYPNWEKKKLGEVAKKQSSNISANTVEENTGDYKLYGASGFLKRIDFFREEEQYISIVKDGAGVGRILLCDAHSSVLGTLDIVKPKSHTDLQFIYALIGNIDFTKYITGSTIPHIYFKDYSKEIINIPCKDEQTKIANFLTAIDQKIEQVNTQITQTQTWKKGLLQKMFV